MLDEGISIILTVSLTLSLAELSSGRSSTEHASKASLKRESNVAPGNLCLATSKKVLGKIQRQHLARQDYFFYDLALLL